MPREHIETPDLTAAVPYHYLASTGGDALIFSAGACPLDVDRAIVAPGDLIAQTRQTLENLATAFGAAGVGIADVIKTTVYVASSDRRDLTTVWNQYVTLFGTDGPPSTLLGVTVLGWPDQLVEIEAIAVSH